MESRHIGNYKGVMICKRPATAKPSKKAPFKNRVHSQTECGQSFRLTANGAYRVRPKSVLRGHRRWLSSFTKDQKQKKLEKQEEEEIRAEKRAKFLERMAEKRQRLTRRLSEFEEQKLLIENFDKPRWAMTQEEDEQADQKEVEELVQFVENLNYDEYVEDLEFKMALEILREKAKKIQNPIQAETETQYPVNNKTNDEKHLNRNILPLQHDHDWDLANAKERKLNAAQKAFADSVIKENPLLKGIHSNASIRQMISSFIGTTPIGPKIEMIRERISTREIEDASNLPYLHRNAAV